MMQVLFVLPLISGLRFPDAGTGLKVDAAEAGQVEISESWCMQFPYCPQGCNAFCIPDAGPHAPASQAVASAVNGGATKKWGSRSHKSRRRKHNNNAHTHQTTTIQPGTTNLGTTTLGPGKRKDYVAKAALNFKLSKTLAKNLLAADVAKLNTDAKFRLAVKKEICKTLNAKKPGVCDLTQAETQITNLILAFKKKNPLDSSYLQLLLTEGTMGDFDFMECDFDFHSDDEETVDDIVDVINTPPTSGSRTVDDVFYDEVGDALVEVIADFVPAVKTVVNTVRNEMDVDIKKEVDSTGGWKQPKTLAVVGWAAATTQAPAATTQAPAGTTQAVDFEGMGDLAATTQAPAATKAPAATTQAPAATKAPAATTQAPAATTQEPATTTNGSGSGSGSR